MDYVKQYQTLDRQAGDAEAQVDEWTAHVADYRWGQCRIAHDAVQSGGYTRRSFAEAVRISHGTINAQVRAWEKYGGLDPIHRPLYGEAMAEMRGGDQTWTRKDKSAARAALRDPGTAREVLSDPEIRRNIMSDDHTRAALSRTRNEIDAQRTATAARQVRETAPKLVEAEEYYGAMARVQHARQDVNKALDLLRGLPPLDADQRHDMKQEVDWLNASIEWLYEMLKGRRPANLADEITEYLAEEGAS